MSTKGTLKIGNDRYLSEGKRLFHASWRRYLYLAGFVLSLLGLTVTCALLSPGEQRYLAAAAGYRANLRYDLALARYADASRAAPTDPAPHCLSGQIRMLQQEWKAAVAAFSQCAEAGPDSGEAWLELGDARSHVGDSAGALIAWKRSAGLGERAAAEQLAEAAEARADVTGALALWRQIRGDRQALAHLGMLELWQGYAPGAEHDMLAALAGGSRAAGWLVTDGFLALASRPEQTADTEGQLGHAFLVANLPALALAPFQHAVKLAPKDGEAHAYLGWTLVLLGRTAQAREEIDQGLELSPSASFAWFAAGELALAEQQPGPAIRYFQEGATLDPHNPLFWAEAGGAALLLHDYASAEQMLQTASDLSKSPAEAIALLHLYVDFHVGFLDGSARHAGIDAVHRWPGNETLELLLAEIFTDNNESANAYYAALAAHVLDPTDPGPYVILGAQAENEGDYGHAALLLRVALALSPDGPFASQAEMLLAPIQDVSA